MSRPLRIKEFAPQFSDELFNKTARTLVIFVALAALPYLIPSLSRYRLFAESIANNTRQENTREAQASDRAAQDDLSVSGSASTDPTEQFAPGEIEDPSGFLGSSTPCSTLPLRGRRWLPVKR